MKNYRLIGIFLIFLTSIFLWGGCTKPRPLGGDYEIHVLADSTIWAETQTTIREIFEKVEYTPQKEYMFAVIKQEPKDYKRYKNLLFVSTLDATDQLSTTIRASLSEAALAKVNTGEIIFTQEQVWAQDQKIVFLIAPDISALNTKILNRKNDIFNQFEQYWRNFHKKILYSSREQLEVEKHLLKNYGWKMRIPLDYKLEKQSARDHFVMLKRKYPDRWISVFWIEAIDPNIITKDWCIKKRDEIGEQQYDGEIVEQYWEPVRAEEVLFQNRQALLLKGLWEHKVFTAGGPFWMYCFFDQATERIYFIDAHLFNPDLKKSKLFYLRQMDIVAQTFQTNLENKTENR